ncbi:MAG: TlpA disulfide reductase family protein [Bacteroidota bacterium]
MKKIILFICVLSIFTSCQEELSIDNLLLKVDTNLNKLETINYNIDFEYTGEQAISFNGNSSLRSVPSDPLNLYHKVICTSRKGGQVYNGENLLIYNEKDSISTVYNILIDGYERARGTYFNALIVDFVFKKDFFTEFKKKALKVNSTLKVELYNDIPVYKVVFFEKDTDGATNIETTYFFRKSDFFPLGYKTQALANGEIPVGQSYSLTNIKKNIILDESTFNLENNILYTDKVHYSKAINSEDKPTLAKGTLAPNFKVLLTNDSQFELHKNKGKIVVLDFWFSSCVPCLKVMPELNKIAEKYDSSEVEIIGINPYNSKEKTLKTLNRKAPNLHSSFKSGDIVADYNVYLYPTIYFIDKNGKVAEVHSGEDENFYDEVVGIIESIKSK